MTVEEAIIELKREIKGQQYDQGDRQLSTTLVEAMKTVVDFLEAEE